MPKTLAALMMARKFSLPLNSFAVPLLELFFPRFCFACSRRIEDKDPFLCLSCKRDLQPANEFSCPVCGTYNTISQENCQLCSTEKLFFDRAVSLLAYNDVVRKLIHELKYNEMTKIASYLTDRTIDYLENENPFSRVDYVCPVPLHRTRRRERGFNQSALIAEKIAKHFDWQYSSKLIRRDRFTVSQSSLSPEGRKHNVSRAFSLDKNYQLNDMNILIIDDIFTTGATVNSISRMLREQQVNKIYVLTVARA